MFAKDVYKRCLHFYDAMFAKDVCCIPNDASLQRMFAKGVCISNDAMFAKDDFIPKDSMIAKRSEEARVGKEG